MRSAHHYRELADGASARRVVSIGNFDGVHIGHAAVLGLARREADSSGCELAVLTFEPHPAEVLELAQGATPRPEGPGPARARPRMRLADFARKESLLATAGVDVALFQRFDAAFAALDPKAFASQVLSRAMRATSVVVGEGFRFGARREGDFAALRDLGGEHGFSVIAAPLVEMGGEPVSSTRIRRALLDGDVAGAARLLGRPHEISGEVVHGRGEGAKLGFPTANLSGVSVLLPAPGIYAARCEIRGETRPAALYVGERPTLGHGFSVEAHLLDFEANLYGARLSVRLVERVRGETRFEGVDALKAQMKTDVARIRDLLKVGDG